MESPFQNRLNGHIPEPTMPFRHDKPIAFFDIESTGVNVRTDRIIDLAIVILHPDGTREQHTFRLNPEIPISPDASVVHGIYDADVKDSPTFKTKANEIDKVLTGCDFGGYNIVRYDIPMLAEEFMRVGVPFSIEGRRLIDAQKLFYRQEPRTLSAALKFYCGLEHEGAHGALADVEATIRVLKGQYKKYTDLPAEIGALHEYCNPHDPSLVDSGGKLKWSGGEVLVNFGLNHGKKLRDLAASDKGKGFLRWMINKDFPRDTQDIIRNALDGRYPEPPAAKQEGVQGVQETQ